MVETKALFNKGTHTGAIDEDAIIVGVPDGWRLMQAPPTTSKQAYAIIFWEPSSAEDREPTFTKVVGVFILFYLLRLYTFISGRGLHTWCRTHESDFCRFNIRSYSRSMCLCGTQLEVSTGE
jgi:hypothetical protein